MSLLAETETGYGTPLLPHALAEIFRLRTRLDRIMTRASPRQVPRVSASTGSRWPGASSVSSPRANGPSGTGNEPGRVMAATGGA